MAATKTYPTILKYGLQANYDALATKDASVLYFCTDTKKIYKGTVDFTDSVIVAATKPTTGIVAGKLYVIADTGTVEVYSGSAWHVVSYPVATEITAASDDVHVATAKAVYDAIQAAISGEGVVNSIAQSTTEGNISVTANGETADVAVYGAVTTPTYDATTRKFTFPVTGKDDVVVELGKDIFIDPQGDNSYHADTKEIWLTLNDGTGEKAATVIKIPASGLIDVYTGDVSDSATVTVGTDNKIKATANLRADEEGVFTNALKLSTAEGKKGLYVDLSDYVTSSQLQAVSDVADAAATKAGKNETAIGVLNGDASTDGSVAKAIATESNTLKTGVIKTAQDTADAAKTKAEANETAIGVLNGDDTKDGSVAKSIKTAVDALDSEKSSAAVTANKGLQVTVKQVDGKIDSVILTGDYDDSYDAKGSAAAVQGNTTATVKAVEDDLDALETTVGDMTAVKTTAKTVAGAVDELHDAIESAGTAGKVYLDVAETATEGFLKTYVLSQGAAKTEIGKIDIPKDLVVTSGEVIVVDAEHPVEGLANGTYIKLTVANQTAPIYINVKDLVDVYTAAQGATQVQVAVSADKKISATIVAGSIGTTELTDSAVTTAKIADANVTKAKLATDVQTSLGKADTAVQTVAEGTTNGTIAVDGADVAVHGLGSAAYTAADAYDAAGTAKAKADAVQGDTTKTVADAVSDAATAQAKADENEENLAALATAVTWGTF